MVGEVGTERRRRWGTEHLICSCVLLLLVAFSAGLRIEQSFAQGGFDQDPVGSVRSDPGLLYYLAQRMDQEGGEPADWHADPRIEHPDPVDVPARFTVGQERLLLLARGLVGEEVPLHHLCVWLMSILAALSCIGVYGLTQELTGSPRWGLLAAFLLVVTPAFYRTVGFVLVREDLALPLLALHPWLAIRAARLGTVPSAIAAALALGGALATWHASMMIATLECGACLVWFLCTLRNPLASRGAAAALLTLVAVTLLNPALLEKGAVLSLPLIMVFGMWVTHKLRVGQRTPRATVLAVCSLLVLVAYGLSVLGGYSADLSHVYRLLAAKLSHLGLLPEDPLALPFQVRMMWQGPFATLSLNQAHSLFLVEFWLLPLLLLAGVLRWQRRQGRDVEQILFVHLVFLCLATWMIQRLSSALVLVLVPVLVVAAHRLTRGGGRRATQVGVFGLLFFQVLGFSGFASKSHSGWQWDVRQSQERELVVAVETLLPEGEPILADFMVSTVLLAHTGRPIVVQPKWEAAVSRDRVEKLWTLLYHSSLDELAAAMRSEFEVRYLLLDRHTLLWLRSSRYLAGLRLQDGLAPAGSALQDLMEGDAGRTPLEVGDFELVWSTGPVAAFPDGIERDLYRLFRLRN